MDDKLRHSRDNSGSKTRLGPIVKPSTAATSTKARTSSAMTSTYDKRIISMPASDYATPKGVDS